MNDNTRSTQFVEGEGLKVPVIDLALGEAGKYLSEPETLRNSPLELIVKELEMNPQDIASLILVKLNPNDNSPNPLARIKFGDGIKRAVAFSSGKSVYCASVGFCRQIRQLFKTQPDHACRYGSLLVSSCNEGAVVLDGKEDNRPLRVKLVDFASDDPQQRAEAERFKTDDCRGIISPRLAKLVGGRFNRPFQFRMVWMQSWQQPHYRTPRTSFEAKGTFLPDRSLTDELNTDLILDRSSIKGINKERLDELIPCGTYQLPKVILGNRSNAKTQNYENSWQFLIWYSPEAIRQDIVPPTRAEAQHLAAIQQNQTQLVEYLSQGLSRNRFRLTSPDLHSADQKYAAKSTDLEALLDTDEAERPVPRMLQVLQNDERGLLQGYPPASKYIVNELAKQWVSLAVKGAVQLESAMAQPHPLEKGTLVAPHLPDGTEVIVTRYPIVSKDNIRRYEVNNQQAPELQRYRGCVFIRPDQAMEHHQCDFDGDQLVVIPTAVMPHIAAETRHANDEREFAAVKKRPKIDYTEATNASGHRQYPSLSHVAAAIPKSSIGKIAIAIGRVQSATLSPDDPQPDFERQKRRLLGRLFDALQIEVDSPKSAVRYKNIYPKLDKQVENWCAKHPSPFFDYLKDERLYRTVPMPTEGDSAIAAIAKEAVNPVWEPIRESAQARDEFRWLFPAPADRQERQSWEEQYLSWAQELKGRYIESSCQIHAACGSDRDALKEAFGQLYEDLRAEVATEFPTEGEQQLAATALWHVETTTPSLSEVRRKCAEVSRRLHITFELYPDYQRLHEAIPKDTYVLSVPFEQYDRDGKGKIVRDSRGRPQGKDLIETWKNALERKGIAFEATLDSELPLVRFAVTDPSPSLVEKLQAAYGDRDNISR